MQREAKLFNMLISSVRKNFAVFYALVLSAVSSLSYALTPHADWFSPQPDNFQISLSEQRYHYELAKDALDKGNEEAFEKHYALLGDYPLTPYLDYSRITDGLYNFDFQTIDWFLITNEGTFLAYRLRAQLLHALATRQAWPDFLRYYEEDMGKVALRCQWLLARIETKDFNAYEQVADIWTEGKSQPKACDPLFDKWRANGGLTDEIAWQRFHNAMTKRNVSLARYVSRYMSDENKKYAQEYLGVHGYPGRIKQQRRFSEQNIQTQQIIAHGIKRFSRNDPIGAFKYWELYEAQQLFPKELSIETKAYLLKRLVYQGHTEQAETLLKNSQELRLADVVERLIREALRNNRLDKAHQWIAYLDDEARSTDRWQYWLARTQDELGVTNTEQSSQSIYATLAKKRSFYGFLSADLLQKDYALEDKPSEVNPSTVIIIENLPAMRRARELWLKGDYIEARAEWHFATRTMDASELAAAGNIARDWGWYNKGIVAMIRGNLWDDLDVRFPLAYRETVEKVSFDTSVPHTLIYAIARQESAFLETALSSAGARGLMQLMPGTARQTARKSGIKHHDSYLYDPAYNIGLGSRYLNELLTRYNGNRILAAAAYNAGPYRVNRWIERTPLDVPFDVWIETIPFEETRGYVQNVLAFSVIYAHRLGQESQFITANEIENVP